MYIYLSSLQSTDVYPANKATKFSVDLHTPLFLDNPQEWEIGLVEAEVPFFVKPSQSDATNFYILCNLVDYSIVNGLNAQVLRKIPIPPEQAAATTNLIGSFNSNPPPSTGTISIVNSQAVPATSTFYAFDPVFYLPCLKGKIENIDITVRSLDLDDLEDIATPMHLTLELRKKLILKEYAQY